MRTTVTIDDDVEAMLTKLMRAKGISFKEALNSALRAGLLAGTGGRRPAPVTLTVFHMKQRRGLNLDKALALAGELEDEELVRKMAIKK